MRAFDWSRVDRGGGIDSCWEWRGNVSPNGYGRCWRHSYVHRVVAEIAHGPCPTGLEVLHACDNRLCCNPLHLSYGTRRENMRGAVERGRHYSPYTTEGRRQHGIVTMGGTPASACKRGHPYPENAVHRTRDGHRQVAYCKACRREARAAGGGWSHR